MQQEILLIGAKRLLGTKDLLGCFFFFIFFKMNVPR